MPLFIDGEVVLCIYVIEHFAPWYSHVFHFGCDSRIKRCVQCTECAMRTRCVRVCLCLCLFMCTFSMRTYIEHILINMHVFAWVFAHEWMHLDAAQMRFEDFTENIQTNLSIIAICNMNMDMDVDVDWMDGIFVLMLKWRNIFHWITTKCYCNCNCCYIMAPNTNSKWITGAPIDWTHECSRLLQTNSLLLFMCFDYFV